MTLSRRDLILAGAAGLLPGTISRGDEKPPPWVKSSLKTLSLDPYNAEPGTKLLLDSWITPAANLYVRSHAPNPKIDASYRLKVTGLVNQPLSISLRDLQSRLKKTNTFATLTCAGNRRNEHSAIKPVKGVPWAAGAIGNAEWGGALLADVLRLAGVKPEAKHVWFEGLDSIPKGGKTIPFGASIPIAKAMSAVAGFPGALICYEMNKKPLAANHGAPIRCLVPGYIGARSVKWLGTITVSDRPSPNQYVQKAYKLVPDNDPKHWPKADPIYSFRINSVICRTTIAGGRRVVSGYALPPGKPGVTIRKVELSTDSKRWVAAKTYGPAQALCWRLWTGDVPRSAKRVYVRATASDGTTQPEKVPWNLKGYLYNGWHKVTF